MAVADGFLWVMGSHGLKRKKAKPELGHADNAKRLAKLALDGNRRLLACLPIEPDAQGEPRLVRQAPGAAPEGGTPSSVSCCARIEFVRPDRLAPSAP